MNSVDELNDAVRCAVSLYLYERNDMTTRAAVERDVMRELDQLRLTGKVYDFKAVCNRFNNPDSVIVSGGIVCDVAFRIEPDSAFRFVRVSAETVTHEPGCLKEIKMESVP